MAKNVCLSALEVGVMLLLRYARAFPLFYSVASRSNVRCRPPFVVHFGLSDLVIRPLAEEVIVRSENYKKLLPHCCKQSLCMPTTHSLKHHALDLLAVFPSGISMLFSFHVLSMAILLLFCCFVRCGYVLARKWNDCNCLSHAQTQSTTCDEFGVVRNAKRNYCDADLVNARLMQYIFGGITVVCCAMIASSSVPARP